MKKYLQVAALLAMTAVFIIDILTPLGVAVGVLYVACLLALLPVSNRNVVYISATAATLYTVLALVFSQNENTSWMVYANRAISVFAIWVVTVIMVYYMNGREKLIQTLHMRKRRYHNMISEIVDYSIILLDESGKIESWNKGAEHQTGYSSEEAIGQDHRIFYDREDIEDKRPEKLLVTAKEEGRVEEQVWQVTKEGRSFFSLTILNTIYDSSGKVTGYSRISRDLSDRRKADILSKQYTQQLEAKNSDLQQFAYIASHDVQEPLRTITSFVDLLEKDYGDSFDEQGTKYMHFITEASRRMNQLIKGLLEYSRLGNNRKLSSIDTEHVVSDIFERFEKDGSGVKFTTSTSNLPVIYGYESEFQLLMTHLISNAIKFAKKDLEPYIMISCETKENEWEFSVLDNGIGIEERHKDRIFGIFQRLHSTKDYDGTGIGLAHCKKIVDLHGGMFSVKSELGGGSTFTFTIPREIQAFEEITMSSREKVNAA